MFKYKKTFATLIVIILVIGGYFYFKSNKPKVKYETIQAQKGNLLRTVSVTGVLESENKINVSFKINGRAELVNYDVGDKVKKGAILARIDKGTLDSQLAQAQATLNAQKEKYSLIKRRDDLYKYEEKQAQKAEVEKARAAITAIREEINETTLRAPIDGIIIRKNIEKGENAIANKTIFTISDENEPIIEADIPESDIVDIKLGQKAEVSLDALSSNENLAAEVTEIEPASTVIQDVVYYKIKLKFEKFDNRLKIGMSADIDINTAEKDDVIMIPWRAVKENGNQKYVEILKTNNQVKKINIRTGLRGDDGAVEVISGLQGGENVITLTKSL